MKLGISLFSSGGIGDLAMRANNIQMLVSNELLRDRAEIFISNYPNTQMIIGDIREKIDEIVIATQEKLQGKNLDFVFATPPCQGMSKNGRGKLLSEARQGRRSLCDERNKLIIPTIEIIKRLQPSTIVFENVPEMEHTKIFISDNEVKILDFIAQSLPNYFGSWEVVEFADYGVPQRRKRLITVFSRDTNYINYINSSKSFLPARTHAQKPSHKMKPWVTLFDAISDVPPLDAKNKETANSNQIEFHRVPILDEEKYFWVQFTPEGKSAFDNQCPHCKHNDNKKHCSQVINGVNQSSKETPLYCSNCNKLLPRPWVKEGTEYRLMRGYTSAYKRMEWGLPASALTRNMSYACSDNKLHPSQNRVLSLYEAFIIHTISLYDYKWVRKGSKVSDKTIREIIGESIPPKGLDIIISHLIKIIDKEVMPHIQKQRTTSQMSLLDF